MKKKPSRWTLTVDTPFEIDIQDFPEADVYPVTDFHHPVHLNLFLAGSMYGKLGTHFFQLEQYDLQITAPWEPHGENRIQKGLRILSINLDPDMLLGNLLEYRRKAISLFLLDPRERHRLVNAPGTKKLRMEFSSSFFDITGEEPEILKLRRWIAIQSMFIELLHCIRTEELPEALYRFYQKLSGAFGLFGNDRNINIQEAADACSLSVSRFSHLFRQVCRMSFAEYEMRRRLSRAVMLLRQGFPAKVAAEQTGFYDASHFSRYFRLYFGITPGKLQ